MVAAGVGMDRETLQPLAEVMGVLMYQFHYLMCSVVVVNRQSFVVHEHDWEGEWIEAKEGLQLYLSSSYES